MAHFSKSDKPLAEEIKGSSQSAAQNTDTEWSGDAWLCDKHLKHYPAISKGGTNISVFSFVWMLEDENRGFPAYMEDLFEDCKGEKMVRLRPFLSGEDVEPLVPRLNPHPREVFMTSTDLEMSTMLIAGHADILTPSHFSKCVAIGPRSFMCHREFKNNSVRPFSVSKLCGYGAQSVVLSLESHSQRSSGGGRGKLTAEAPAVIMEIPKDIGAAVGENQGKKCETDRERLTSKLASRENMARCTEGQPPPEGGENVEVLSQDSGLRGCWFRCRILRSTKKCLKVQYYDVTDVDGPGKLEEWVARDRVANPDKLGIRSQGRLTVRPWPLRDSSDFETKVGTAVDTWCCDGWWEAIVTGFDSPENRRLQVYFPGENSFSFVDRKDVRISKDWIDDLWVDVKPMPNIFSYLNLYLNPLSTMQTPLAYYNNSTVVNSNVPSSSGASMKDLEGLQLEQLLKIQETDGRTDDKSSENAVKDRKGKKVSFYGK